MKWIQVSQMCPRQALVSKVQFSLSYIKCGKFLVQPSGCCLYKTGSARRNRLDLFQVPFYIFKCIYVSGLGAGIAKSV
jgi:hypothetical protein